MIFTPAYYERLRKLEAGGWWNRAMRDILARAIAGAHPPAAGVLLDVGCGSGETLDWFVRSHPRWRGVGVDVAFEALHAVMPLPTLSVAGGSALDLPIRSASIDVVISQDVLQHLPLDGGDLKALAEMRRVLKPGGLLILRTNAQSLPRTRDDAEYQFRRYDTADLRRKLTSSGFTIDRLGRVNALLGLMEIPRERAALRRSGRGYHGVLAVPGHSPLDPLKRWWLALEGRLALAGWALPLGRTHIATCRAGGRG
jgi:SAM-dependent methyltransferase